jgi:hypothetical protein
MKNSIESKMESFYSVSFYAAVAMLIIIPVQIIIFVLSPHPDSIQGWLDLFGNNWILGVIHFDGLYIINNIILAVLYVALFILLYEEHQTLMILALLFGLLGIVSYFSSNKAVEMFFLSKEYWGGTSGLPDEVFFASVQNFLLSWRGTAFDIYYVLNGITLFLISFAMVKSQFFTTRVAVIGFISAFLMIIPSNFGTIGLICSLLSLIPWYIFTIMMAKVFRLQSTR